MNNFNIFYEIVGKPLLKKKISSKVKVCDITCEEKKIDQYEMQKTFLTNKGFKKEEI
jgi:hypothetical protein